MKFCFWGAISQGLEGKPIGGGEQQLALIAKTLNHLGHEVVIVDSEEREDKEINGIQIISIPKRVKTNLFRHFTFYSILKKIKADVYYARIRSSIHLLALRAAKKNQSIFIYHLASDLDALNFSQRWKGFYSKIKSPTKIIKHIIHSELLFPLILRHANLVVCQNEEQYNNLKKKGVKNRLIVNNLFEIQQNISLVPKGDDTMNKKYFLYIGSLDLRKGVRELLALINSNKDQQYVIIGTPRDKFGKNFVQSISDNDKVSYLGQLSHSEVLNYLINAKALINTSIYEGFSNAFIESWSLGVPVLSLNVDPSNNLSKYDLGVCYHGDLNLMSENISKDAAKYNKLSDFENMINYVKRFHNPVNNTFTLISKIEKLC